MTDPFGLTADSDCEAALIAILQDCGLEIDQHIAAFLDAPGPEGPHKARVALRRLTTALDAFDKVLRGARAAKLRRKSKEIFRLLGQVRDADILQAARDAAGQPAAAEAASDQLRDEVRRKLRKIGAVTFGARLQTRRLQDRLLRDGRAARKARKAPVRTLAATALHRARRDCLDHGPDLAGMSQKRRHELRKDLKSFRYLSEFFQPVWPSDADSQLRQARFQQLQDSLGVLTDLDMIRRRRPDHPVVPGLPDQALSQAQADWSHLQQESPWWQTAAPPADRAVTKASSD